MAAIEKSQRVFNSLAAAPKTTMSELLQSALSATSVRFSERFQWHQDRPEVSVADIVKKRRAELASLAHSKTLIYLDTNAWKCIADYRQAKSTLQPAMVAFALALEEAVRTKKFLFPIALPTFMELDAITTTSTRQILANLVDEMSLSVCVAPFPDRIGSEFHRLMSGSLSCSTPTENAFCSPIELYGIPTISFSEGFKSAAEQLAFNKAMFDLFSELPFSVQLHLANESSGDKWNNSKSTARLNSEKSEFQHQINNLNAGLVHELNGILAVWAEEENVPVSPLEILTLTLQAVHHWQQVPNSASLPFLRVLSSLYGLMRFDAHRKFHHGDSNDFMIAASAVPVADAFFTDRKLANLLLDPRIKLKEFSNCTVVGGFENMAGYLTERL